MSKHSSAQLLGPELVDEQLRERFASLTAQEYEALRSALAYHFDYAKFDIVKQLDNDSMPARHNREKFRELHSGMAKLGIRVRSPLPEA